MTLEVNLPLYASHIISAADTIAALQQTAAYVSKSLRTCLYDVSPS